VKYFKLVKLYFKAVKFFGIFFRKFVNFEGVEVHLLIFFERIENEEFLSIRCNKNQDAHPLPQLSEW
jgi:hypothetical protein